MQEIARAILLPAPPPTALRAGVRVVSGGWVPAIETARAPRQPQGALQAFPAPLESRREDTVEIKGKQFRFRPYGGRGTTDGGARAVALAGEAADAGVPGLASQDEDVPVDILESLGSGVQQRNSSAFIAGLIAQERMRQGLYNPRFEAASEAYRRAGGSPAAIDDQPRAFRLAV